VDLNTFIKLFVNHRPVYGIGKQNIEQAFKILAETDKAENAILMKEAFRDMLETEGEMMGVEELQDALF
jgi:hypothetical protein